MRTLLLITIGILFSISSYSGSIIVNEEANNSSIYQQTSGINQPTDNLTIVNSNYTCELSITITIEDPILGTVSATGTLTSDCDQDDIDALTSNLFYEVLEEVKDLCNDL